MRTTKLLPNPCGTEELGCTKIVGHYMDYSPREKEASLERARESLIALSYCQPEKIADSTKSEKVNNKDKAVDELRSKLISITSMDPGSKAAGEV